MRKREETGSTNGTITLTTVAGEGELDYAWERRRRRSTKGKFPTIGKNGHLSVSNKVSYMSHPRARELGGGGVKKGRRKKTLLTQRSSYQVIRGNRRKCTWGEIPLLSRVLEKTGLRYGGRFPVLKCY